MYAPCSVEQALGFRSLHLLRGVQRLSDGLLLAVMDTLVDRVDRFRGSSFCARWMSLIVAFSATGPAARHVATVDGGAGR